MVIKALGLNSAYYPDKITQIKLLGTDQELTFNRENDALTINLPDNVISQVAYSVRIISA
jgi:hypothetical protein